jgi:peptidoglycan/xylan/chitin deacetylase (PgdA/CDA1 family)
MRLRHRVFAAGLRAVVDLHADRWLRVLAQGCGVILMFHRVRPRRAEPFAPNRALEITPEFLDFVLAELRREGFDIVPLEAVPSRLCARRFSRPFAALTFDDGYRDNAEHAWPVLKRHGAAWALFVTAEFADGRGRLWWVELEEAIARLDRIVLHDGGTLRLPTRTAREKQAAFNAVSRRLRAAPEQRLMAATKDIAVQAGIDVGQVTRTHCLGWNEIRTLASEPDVTIGSHTLSHPILAMHDMSRAAREIADSRALIERRLGRSVGHFAYPFGDRFAASRQRAHQSNCSTPFRRPGRSLLSTALRHGSKASSPSARSTRLD